MRKALIILLLGCIAISVSAQIQPNTFQCNPDKNFLSARLPGNFNHARTTQCGPDTVYYGYAKATSIRGLNINTANSANKVAQWFDVPEPIMIHGFTFFAWQGFGTSDTVPLTCSAIIAGIDSLPTGPVIATTTIKVDSTFGNGNLNVLKKTAIFNSPVFINFPFVLVIETASPISVSLVASDWDSADGGMEWLASANIPASGWLHGYNVNVGGAVLNADFLFQPIVSYDIDASFLIDTNCISNGGMVTFTNTSNNPILYNRFYNQYAFDANDSLAYTWFYDDGSPLDFFPDVQHTFAAGQDYEVTLNANMVGWTSVCTESFTTIINPSTTSDFSYTENGLNVSFDNNSLHADSCYWDFGDGTNSKVFNPLHTFPSKTSYEVTLICYGLCSNDTFNMVVALCDSVSSDFNYTVAESMVNFNVAMLTGSASFQWDFDDGTNGSGISISHTYGSTGTYNVCLVVTNNCISDTTCEEVKINITGMEEVNLLNNVAVYPTPANNLVIIRFDSQTERFAKIELYNHIGQTVNSVTTTASGEIQIKTGDFPTGVYIMRIEMDERSTIRKVAIAR